MNYKYKTRGTCSREISFELENGIVKNVSFYGGCNGNLKGIAALVEGKKAEEIIPLKYLQINLYDKDNVYLGSEYKELKNFY